MNNLKHKTEVLRSHAAEFELSKQTKARLIRKFQRLEGNFDCCATAYQRVCNQFECLWRDDCILIAYDNERHQ